MKRVGILTDVLARLLAMTAGGSRVKEGFGYELPENKTEDAKLTWTEGSETIALEQDNHAFVTFINAAEYALGDRNGDGKNNIEVCPEHERYSCWRMYLSNGDSFAPERELGSELDQRQAVSPASGCMEYYQSDLAVSR